MKNILYKTGDFIQRIIIKNLLLFITLGFIRWSAPYYPDFEILSNIFTTYVIPLSVGYTTGNMIDKKHGGASGIIGTSLVIYTALMENLLEVILISFLVSWTVKIFKEKILSKVIPGFEMFAVNIFVPFTALAYYFIFLKTVPYINILFNSGNELILKIGNGFLGIIVLTSLIEVGKIFFINNFINHGFLALVGYREILTKGGSIFFLLESNPGPGLGVLIALYVFLTGKRKNIFSNIIIEFFGGIHEMYFPYVLKNMKLIAALICGGLAGNLFFYFFNVTLSALPSPGSVIIITMLSAVPRFYLLTGIFLSAGVSFVTAYMILLFENKKTKERPVKDNELENRDISPETLEFLRKKENIVISILCSGGMGSSHIGKTFLKKILSEKGIKNVEIHSSFVGDKIINSDIIITHNNFKNKVQAMYPESIVAGLEDYVDREFYNNFVEKFFVLNNQETKKEVLPVCTEETEKIEINLGLKSVSKDEAVSNTAEKIDADTKNMLSAGKRILILSKTENNLSDKIIINQYPYGIKDNSEIFIVIGISTSDTQKYKNFMETVSSISENQNIISELEISDDKEYFLKTFNIERLFGTEDRYA